LFLSKQDKKFKDIKKTKMKKIVAIRIRGTVNIPRGINDTLYILKLRKKFTCVLLDSNKETEGMLKKVKDYVAFGEIDQETLKQLLLKRGKKQGDKNLEIAGKTIEEFTTKFLEGKTGLEDLKIKPFFRLNPPRGGFKGSIKKPWPKGVLGYYGIKINELVKRML
jgi:large subunit ribosomal protein L30